jgi:cytochrome c5
MRHKGKTILSCIFWSLLVGILAAQLAAAQSAPAQKGTPAQMKKGREVIGETCVACHTNILKMLQIHKESPEQWRNTVYSMIARGAEVMPDEIQPVLAYLAANAGNESSAITQTAGGTRRGRGNGQQTQGAEGRAILQRSCLQCHDMATASKKLPSEDWNTVIGRMMTYGAKLTPADHKVLVTYLNGLTNPS